MSVPNSVKIPLDSLWEEKDFKHLIMALGFATGMVDSKADSETKKLYEQTAFMCAKFVEAYNKVK